MKNFICRLFGCTDSNKNELKHFKMDANKHYMIVALSNMQLSAEQNKRIQAQLSHMMELIKNNHLSATVIEGVELQIIERA